MEQAAIIIDAVSVKSKRAILFHSGTGKDSIALLDLMSSHFDEIICVFMWVVKDLSHIAKYMSWAQNKYPNCRFVQVPHFATLSYIKYGFMGCTPNPKQRLWKLIDIDRMMREKFGVDFVFYGFKQSDSLNRRLMLRTYDQQAVNWKTGKVYPLSTYKNADILKYIEDNDLMRPESYGKGQSSGTDITSIDYLLWLRKNHPQDLKRVYAAYPLTQSIIFENEQENKV